MDGGYYWLLEVLKNKDSVFVLRLYSCMLCVILDQKPESKKEDEEQAKWELSTQVYDLEDCLREVLSDVLEVEMKAAFDDLWLEVK